MDTPSSLEIRAARSLVARGSKRRWNRKYMQRALCVSLASATIVILFLQTAEPRSVPLWTEYNNMLMKLSEGFHLFDAGINTACVVHWHRRHLYLKEYRNNLFSSRSKMIWTVKSEPHVFSLKTPIEEMKKRNLMISLKSYFCHGK